MPAVPGSTVPKYLVISGVLMVHVREHWDLKLNPALKEVHPPPGQSNLSASVKRITKLLFCRTAVRKSQDMEINMKICQEPSVEMPSAILKLTSPGGKIGCSRQCSIPLGVSVSEHVMRYYRTTNLCLVVLCALSIPEKLRGSSCRGHHLKNRGTTISNIKMRH